MNKLEKEFILNEIEKTRIDMNRDIEKCRTEINKAFIEFQNNMNKLFQNIIDEK